MRTGPESRNGLLLWWGFFAWFVSGEVALCYLGSIVAALVLFGLALAWLVACVRLLRPPLIPRGGSLGPSRGLVPCLLLAIAVVSIPTIWWHPLLPGEPAVTTRHCLVTPGVNPTRRVNTSYDGGRCGPLHAPLGAPALKPFAVYTVRYSGWTGYIVSTHLEVDLMDLPPGDEHKVVCTADKAQPWVVEGDHFRVVTSCGSYTTKDPSFEPRPGGVVTMVVHGSELVVLVQFAR